MLYILVLGLYGFIVYIVYFFKKASEPIPELARVRNNVKNAIVYILFNS